MPAQTASVVVIGSGAFGASTAYHLARRGADVVLLDQHALGSQTSPRAAGLTSKADNMPVMARLRDEACEALAHFESTMGRSVGCQIGRASCRERCWLSASAMWT